MPIINSQYIKANVQCVHCQCAVLKRKYKKSFVSAYNAEFQLVKEKQTWRQFACSKCKGITNVLSNDLEIISVSANVVLPLAAYEFFFHEDTDNTSSICIYFCQDIADAYSSNIVDAPADMLDIDNILEFSNIMSINGYVSTTQSENNVLIIPAKYHSNINSYYWGDALLTDAEKTALSDFMVQYGAVLTDD